MVFMTFDATLGDPPAITKLMPPPSQLVPYTPEPDPLNDSPLESRAREMARQLERVARMLNTQIIAAGDMMRQVRACAKALEESANTVGGPAHSLALVPSTQSIQTRASREARADWSTVANVDITPEQQARFWRKVVRTPEHWVWRGALDRVTGRGQFRVGSRVLYAHRIAYTLHTSLPLDGENLKNICGQPTCVKPDHQQVGSLGAALRAPRRHPVDDEHDRELLEAAARRYDEYTEQSREAWAVRNMDTTPYAKDRYGHQKLCRKGHPMTVQPGGRVTCRACDLDRKKRYDARHTLVNQREQFVRQTRAELADGLDREFTDNLLAQVVPADAPPDPAQDLILTEVTLPQIDLTDTQPPRQPHAHEKPIKITTNPDTGEEERWYPLEAPKTTEFLPAIVEETADMAGYEEAYERTVGDKLSNLRMLRPTKNPDGAPDA